MLALGPRPIVSLPTASLLAIALGTACGEEGTAPRPDADETELESGRIGHVHVVLQPRIDPMMPSPTLRIEGRFAEYRGMDETSARLRANFPRAIPSELELDECVPTERPFEGATPTEPDEGRELTLFDGGDLRVAIGTEDVVVPLALVPDLLTWVSGVEYVYVSDGPSPAGSAPARAIPVEIRLDGADEGELAGFEAHVDLPASFEILPAAETSTREAPGALDLRWQPAGAADDVLVLHLVAFDEVAPVGREITCLARDSGHLRLDVGHLHEIGLARADLVRVTARRLAPTRARAPGFGDVDVLVELRDQQLVPQP
jgi:hypothetical protein